MNEPVAKFDVAARRAAVLRTAWIAAGFAVAVLILFFLKQGVWK